MTDQLSKIQDSLLSQITQKLSPKTKYQKAFIALNCLIWIQLNYLCMVSSFVFMNPIFICEGYQTPQTVACMQLDKCQITNSFTATFRAHLYCGEKQDQRQYIQSAYWFGSLIGAIMIPVIADWKGRKLPFLLSMIMMTVSTFLLILGIYSQNSFIMFMTESFKNTVKQAEKILSQYEQIIATKDQKSIKDVLIEVFSQKKTVKALVLVFLLYGGYNFQYFGVQMCFQRIGFSFGLTMLLVGLSQFLSNSVCGIFIHKIQRKKGLYFTISLGTLLGLLFLFPAIASSQSISTLIIPFYRITSVINYVFIIMLQTESFHTTIRSTAVGLITSAGKIFNMIIPFLVTWLNDQDIHPIIGTTALFFCLSVLPAIFVDETSRNYGKKSQSTQRGNSEELVEPINSE